MEDAKAWQLEYEKTWAKARAIVAKYPHLDPSGVYHALCNLRRTPAERLKRGLAHGRLGPRRR